MLNNESPILFADFYKPSHISMYDKRSEIVQDNMTPRNAKHFIHFVDDDNRVMMAGLQGFIKWFLIDMFNNNFFKKSKEEALAQYKEICDISIGPGMVETWGFEKLHDLGYLPLEIRSLPEGTLSPVQVPLFTIQNTHPDFYWLPNYLESVMSAETWKTITTATTFWQYRKLSEQWAAETCDNNGHVLFQNHCFAYRGESGTHDAAQSEFGQLINSMGTDTIPAIVYANRYYGMKGKFVAGSIPASEHSVATTNIGFIVGRLQGENPDLTLDEARFLAEVEFLRRYITEIFPKGFISYVADSYDFWAMITRAAKILKKEIMERDGRVVFRPDCYDEETRILTDSGFKFFKDLLPTDLVAQVLDDGSYEFIKPLKYVAEHYEGDMIKFKDEKGKLDLLVTPNHRMIYTRRGKEVINEAKDMPDQLHHHHHFIRSAKAREDVENNLTWKQRLAIAFQADGSFCTNQEKTKIRFGLQKERKISRILNILSQCGYDPVVYDLKDGRKEVKVQVDFEITKDFSWVDTDCLTAGWCREFIEEVSYWDAHRRSDTRFKVDSTTKSVIDKIELIALSAGYGVYRSEREDCRKEIFSNVHTLHIMKNNKLGGQAYSKSIVEGFSGMVYCVQVPTGRLVVKRNKSVLVCGNSGIPEHIISGYRWDAVSYSDYSEAMGAEPEAYEVVCINGKYHPVVQNQFGYTDIDESVELAEHEVKGAIECLWDIFGGEVNSKGYKVLDTHVGLIYGDSITVARAKDIFQRLKDRGFASSNIVFGVGSYTTQYTTRDSLGMAVKATGAVIDGKQIMVVKEPKTDLGKKSAKGFLKVIRNEAAELELVDNLELDEVQDADNELRRVFLNGKLIVDEDLTTIRERAAAQL